MDANDQEQTAPAHILVIESDDEVIDSTRELLETAGFQVTTADLPDIGIVRRVEPSAIVTGIMYRGDPGGLAFLEHNKTDPILARVPVVVRMKSNSLAAADQDRLDALGHPVIDTDDHAALMVHLTQVLVPVAG